MAKFGGQSFTQFLNVNVMDELRIQGVKVSTGGAQDRSNYVLVKSKADLPLPVGGLITLAEDFDYEINGTIDLITDRIEGDGSNVVFGQNPRLDKIITSNAGPMISMVDQDLAINLVTLSNPTGRLFDGTDTGGDTAIFSVKNCNLTDSLSLGTIGDIPLVTFGSNLVSGVPDGLVFSGTGIILDLSSNTFQADDSGVIIDLGNATFDAVNINSNFLRASVGTTFISALSDSGNIESSGQGSILNNVTIGSAPSIIGISPGDIGWDLIANNTLPDTFTSGSIYMSANATDTVISSTGVDVKVVGTTIESSLTNRFVMTDDNEITYLGRKVLFSNISYSVTSKRTSGNGGILVTYTVFKNGSPIDGGSQSYEIDNRERNVTVLASTPLVTNDVIELFVKNVDDTNDILVTDLTAIVEGN